MLIEKYYKTASSDSRYVTVERLKIDTNRTTLKSINGGKSSVGLANDAKNQSIVLPLYLHNLMHLGNLVLRRLRVWVATISGYFLLTNF